MAGMMTHFPLLEFRSGGTISCKDHRRVAPFHVVTSVVRHLRSLTTPNSRTDIDFSSSDTDAIALAHNDCLSASPN
jgi:hypothetical protein